MSDLAKTSLTRPPLHLYSCDGGPPWVFAESVDDARKVLANYDYEEISASASIVELPGNERFGITFDDVPNGFTPDCPHGVDEKYFECVEDCGESRNSVTMTVAEWCLRHRATKCDPVIGDINDM